MPRGRHRGGTCPFLPPRAPAPLLFTRALRCSGAFSPSFSLANSGGQPPRRSSAEPPLLLRQSGATGPRASTVRSPPPPSPPSRGSSSPFPLSWSSSSSSPSMAQPSGSWTGSYMREDDIARLVRLRRIPAEVITRVPGELSQPNPGERVVFGAHFDRGLGLPASNFFREFLDYFGLQPHHLPSNACVLLSCYVAFMEGYAGLWPDVEFWSRLFYIKAQTTDGHLRTCGSASIYSRTGTPFPKIPTVDSYNPAPPTSWLNWGYNAKTSNPDAEVNLLWDFLGASVSKGRLSAEDLLCTYIERRVLPLQMRVHKIGHMSGRFDPTRTSKVALTKAQVARRVNNVTKANMPENWDWGLMRHDRASPPELLFDRQGIEDGDLAQKIGRRIMLIRLTKPATQPATTSCRRCPTKAAKGSTTRRPRQSNGRRSRRRPLRGRSPRCLCARGRLSPRRLLRQEEKTGRRGPRPRRTGPSSAGGAQEGSGGSRGCHKVHPGGVSVGSRVVPPLPRQRREPTPPPSTLARAPPVVVVPPATTPPSAGASSSAAPPSVAPGHGAQGESAHRPTMDELFPRRAPLLGPAAGAGRGAPPATGAGAGGAAPPGTGVGGAAPSVVVLEESPEGAPQAPEMTAPHRSDCVNCAASGFGAVEGGAGREGAGEG
ncbi:hypothetical protein QYE76_066713 [Lolium multiflorum]|uniref:Transposase (putative) gypsy type domain-containing protein n=1 Tax=Lolium multiflorum TaxID=4521 RepID=A0AAD8SC37_LOLMU|nr:hypothetical protein QYE76_066713 [Lolium multiflorum]